MGKRLIRRSKKCSSFQSRAPLRTLELSEFVLRACSGPVSGRNWSSRTWKCRSLLRVCCGVEWHLCSGGQPRLGHQEQFTIWQQKQLGSGNPSQYPAAAFFASNPNSLIILETVQFTKKCHLECQTEVFNLCFF